jgi:hypothetical protein
LPKPATKPPTTTPQQRRRPALPKAATKQAQFRSPTQLLRVASVCWLLLLQLLTKHLLTKHLQLQTKHLLTKHLQLQTKHLRVLTRHMLPEMLPANRPSSQCVMVPTW